jgi:ATP-binding cassette subfamily B protein
MDTHFFKTRPTGDLMSRIAEDVSRVRMYTGPAIMYLINLVTIIVFAVYNMLGKNVALTLYCLAPLPILAVTIYYVNNIIHRRSEKIQALLGDLTSQAQQAYSGIRVIKSYVQEKAMLGFFDAKSEKYRDNAIGLAKVESIYFPSITLLIGLSTLITIMTGGIFFLEGKISEVGVIVEFVLYINMLTFPVSAIGWVASMIQRAAASQKRLNELLEEQPAITNPEKPKHADALHPFAVELRQVSFTYPHTGITALRNLNLQIGLGQRVAVIGRTGSGKSTVAHLLTRMYDAQQGEVRVNGQLVQDYSLAELRKQISCVPQDVFLFSETVENNIRFGYPQADLAAVKRAARLAVVDREIDSFEKGYDTMVGERGVTLSGGQKQRVSIARALVKPASILILDDCLSAVDASTEKEVLHHLNEYLQDKTAIIITHRIFSLLQFDQILVLDDGEVIEQGTHEQLLTLNGEYAALYARQQERNIGDH